MFFGKKNKNKNVNSCGQGGPTLLGVGPRQPQKLLKSLQKYNFLYCSLENDDFFRTLKCKFSNEAAKD